MPAGFAVNFHDSLLPEYAGVNATSWAIIDGQTKHGVTWHIATEKLDAGPILKQAEFDIESSETATTLSAKCYETGVALFEDLVIDIECGRVTPISQDLCQRTYFGKYEKPTDGGVVDWRKGPDAIDALFRGLSFGSYPNPLCTPKVLLGDELLVAKRWQVLDRVSEREPGTITDVLDDHIEVTTAGSDIAVGEFAFLNGAPYPLVEAMKTFRRGDKLPEFSADWDGALGGELARLGQFEEYWVERLENLIPLEMPTRRPAHLLNDRGRPLRLDIARTYPKGEGVAESELKWISLLADIVAYLASIGRQNVFDLLLRIPQSDSWSSQFSTVFATHVPLNIDTESCSSVDDIIRRAHSQIEDCLAHETYPKDIAIRYPSLRHLAGVDGSALIPLTIVIVDEPETYSPLTHEELVVAINQNGSGFSVFFDPTRYPESATKRLIVNLQAFLESVPDTSGDGGGQISLVEPSEHELLDQFSGRSVEIPDECVHVLFEAQAIRNRDAIAVTIGEDHLSYGELNRRADRLAHHLRRQGVNSGEVVGIWMERSVEVLVAMLGILKAGAAYLPLETNSPDERLEFILNDANVTIILTVIRWRGRLDRFGGVTAIEIDDEFGTPTHIEQSRQPAKVTPEHIAYVIYTSGTTGNPKGVEIPHRAIVRLLFGVDYVKLSQSVAILQLAPISFDAATFEIWGALLHGAKAVLYSRRFTPSAEELRIIIQDERINLMWMTSGLFNSMIDENPGTFSELEQLVVGGEALSAPHVRLCSSARESRTEIVNGYGPTEVTTFSCCYPIPKTLPDDFNSVPIGTSISNTWVYVLSRMSYPVPIGVPGELHIGGAGLARGYLNRPELTAEKFVPNPFSDVPGSRLYRTGDLARYLPDGNIEFLGRLDHQVKIRGYRIELEEIETVLRQHQDVQDAAVVAREDTPGNKRLVAYTVNSPTEAAAPDALRNYLKLKLPAYMVPADFVRLDALPLTANGKVDRSSLPSPTPTRNLTSMFVGPRTRVEETILRIWKEILGIERIGVDDDFFELGGHSLVATQILSRLRDSLGVTVGLGTLFSAPTVARLSTEVETHLATSSPPISPSVGSDRRHRGTC